MALFYFTLFVSFILFSSSENSFTSYNSAVFNTAVKDGKEHYESIVKYIGTPKYGECWRQAVQMLNDDCMNLNEYVQVSLALRFSYCFLVTSGQDVFECQNFDKSCLKNMPDRAFDVYVKFFTHTQNMCFYLKSELWQEETESTITRLALTSQEVSKQMEEAEKTQKMLLEEQQKTVQLQEKSVNLQNQVIQNGQALSRTVQKSQSQVRDLMEDLRVATDEQKGIMFQVFDRLATLQNWVIGEISWLQMVFFYIVAVIIMYIATSTERTKHARFQMFIVLSSNSIAEILIWRLMIQDGDNVKLSTNQIYWWIWLSRKVAVFMCLVIFVKISYQYRNYSHINHKLLLDIQHQNAAILDFINKLGSTNIAAAKKDAIDSPSSSYPSTSSAVVQMSKDLVSPGSHTNTSGDAFFATPPETPSSIINQLESMISARNTSMMQMIEEAEDENPTQSASGSRKRQQRKKRVFETPKSPVYFLRSATQSPVTPGN